MPLVGGELAKATFDHGFEEYGVDILRRYHGLAAAKGETYLWYFPDGTPASVETSTSPEAQPTDGWGSSAMLYALIGGLAGVEDRGKCFDRVRLSPRWPAAGLDEAEVRTTYAASDSGFGYNYRASGKGIEIVADASAADVEFHVLLPAGVSPHAVRVAGVESAYESIHVRQSRYVDFAAQVRGELKIEIDFS